MIIRLTWIVITLITIAILITALAYNAIDWWNWNPTPADCPPDQYEGCIGGIQANQQLGVTDHFWSVYFTLGSVLEMLPWVLVGILIFWRSYDSLFEILFSLMLVLIGCLQIDPIAGTIFYQHYQAFYPAWRLLAVLGSTLLLLWYRFPNGRFVPSQFRWLAGLWILLQILFYFFPNSALNVFSWPDPWPQIINNVFIFTLIISMVYRYRYVSGPVERQQTKWVVTFGAFFGFLYIASEYVYRAFRTPGMPTAITNLTFLPLYYIAAAMFAASFGVAILRFRLWDIDIIIRRTLIYGALTGTLTLIYLLLVIASQILFPAGSQVAIIGSTLAIAGMFTPLRRRIQRDIDRRFYRSKYNAEQVTAAFTASLREQVDPDQLIDRLVNVVEETIQPESISLWLKPVPGEKPSRTP